MIGNRVAEFTSKVIPSAVEESRCETVNQFRGILRLRLASLRMTAFTKTHGK
jgi:hypothetical protein